MVHRVQRIGVGQLAKIMGVLDLALGVVIALCIYLFSSVMPRDPMTPAIFPMGGMAVVIFLPLLYGVFGYVGGALVAWLYNLVAGWVGGLEFEIGPVTSD